MSEPIYDPTTSAIRDAVRVGTHRVEFLRPDGRWLESHYDWSHQYRLVPVAPKTERVPLHRLIGRRLPQSGNRVTEVHVYMDRSLARTDAGKFHNLCDLHLDSDGTVEVLAEDES